MRVFIQKCIRRGIPPLLAVAVLGSAPAFAQTSTYSPQGDSAQREFIMACTYGVLAGTLIGAATLAFEDRPGDNLNKVARGASLGLYAGILLGAYVIYVVPGMDDDLEKNPLISSQLQVFPTVNLDGDFDGAEMRYQILSF